MKAKVINVLKKVLGGFLILMILGGIIVVIVGIYTAQGTMIYGGAVNIAIWSSILWLCGRWEKIKAKQHEKA